MVYKNFEELVIWYGIDGIFVEKNKKSGEYEVYDLEVGDGSKKPIEKLPDKCKKWSWSQKIIL